MVEVVENGLKFFPNIEFREANTFSGAFQVHFVGDLEEFQKQQGDFARSELELDGIFKSSTLENGEVYRKLFVHDKQNLDRREYEDLLGKVVKRIKTHKVQSFECSLPSGVPRSKLGYLFEVMNYCFEQKNTWAKAAAQTVKQITFVHNGESLINDPEFQWYLTIGIHKNLARDLTNGRTNVAGVDFFLDDCRRRCEYHNSAAGKGPRVEHTIIQGDELLQHRLTLLHAVGKGSVQKPALVNLKYQGNPSSNQYFALVGKGIVFDQGGVDFKSVGLTFMFMDKGGASCVYSAFWAAVASRLKTNVVCTIALAENIISGSCFRPSDIYTSLAGLTVEITNTDCEGRLVLADAMTWTQSTYKLTHLVELSTLTGAVVLALKDLGGIFSNDAEFAAKFRAHAESVSDYSHVLPLSKSCDKEMNSLVADLRNYPFHGHGGAITAAMFLKRFVTDKDVKWIHYDIAAATLSADVELYTSAGATGFGVGAILEFLKREIEPTSA